MKTSERELVVVNTRNEIPATPSGWIPPRGPVVGTRYRVLDEGAVYEIQTFQSHRISVLVEKDERG